MGGLAPVKVSFFWSDFCFFEKTLSGDERLIPRNMPAPAALFKKRLLGILFSKRPSPIGYIPMKGYNYVLPYTVHKSKSRSCGGWEFVLWGKSI
jgi:hypothetical protein